MIRYHGTPITPNNVALQVLSGRHGMVSFANPQQIAMVAEVCQSFTIDNGAFTTWQQGVQFDRDRFYSFVEEWCCHPGFDWALIPDVIDGGEDENDALIAEWPFERYCGVPVWHLHESLDRLKRLELDGWHKIAIGSSGEYATIGTSRWWSRMGEAMGAICDDLGRPLVPLHGLRMLDRRVFGVFPFASADSTNVARNHNRASKWDLPGSTYALVMATRIEAAPAAARWQIEQQRDIFHDNTETMTVPTVPCGGY